MQQGTKVCCLLKEKFTWWHCQNVMQPCWQERLSSSFLFVWICSGYCGCAPEASGKAKEFFHFWQCYFLFLNLRSIHFIWIYLTLQSTLQVMCLNKRAFWSCVSVMEGAAGFLPLGLGLGLETFWSWSGGRLWHWIKEDFKNQASWSWSWCWCCVIIICSSYNATNTLHFSC